MGSVSLYYQKKKLLMDQYKWKYDPGSQTYFKPTSYDHEMVPGEISIGAPRRKENKLLKALQITPNHFALTPPNPLTNPDEQNPHAAFSQAQIQQMTQKFQEVFIKQYQMQIQQLTQNMQGMNPQAFGQDK